MSAGYSFETLDERGRSRATITEASLTDTPAHPESYVLGLYTPQLIVTAEGSRGELVRRPGPRASEYLLERELREALRGQSASDTLATLATLPDLTPAAALVGEARAAMVTELLDQIEERYTPIELITTGPLLEVRSENGSNFVECRCVPYGKITDRTPGRQPERFHRGAFVGTDPGKVKLTDNNHATDRRPVGIATRLDERDDGLYGVFRFFRTPEGRAAWENVREHTYGGVSVGFIALDAPTIGGVREVRAARLDHVSLVDQPAYDGADILAVL
jgi:hypothetical protein